MIKKFKQFVIENLQISEGAYGNEPSATDDADDIMYYLVEKNIKRVEKELINNLNDYKKRGDIYDLITVGNMAAGVWKWSTTTKKQIEDIFDDMDSPYSGTFKDLPSSLQKIVKEIINTVISKEDEILEDSGYEKWMDFYNKEMKHLIR